MILSGKFCGICYLFSALGRFGVICLTIFRPWGVRYVKRLTSYLKPGTTVATLPGLRAGGVFSGRTFSFFATGRVGQTAGRTSGPCR